MTMEPGTVYGNRYTLDELIAVGGMGEVWKATDKVLGRTVAIKLLSPALATQPGFEERFREEARHTALLSHPNIATVYDYGETDGASWLVMEFVEGEPLSAIIREEGPQSPRRTAMVVGQCAEALQAAHEAGVIHRDVKPANIMVRPDGVVKLTDFGIARATDAAPMTRTGEVMGTAQYISPEQAMGRPVSPKSDIYSLGVVAHELLTGRRPFDDGSPVATAMAHVHKPPPELPSSVPPTMAAVIMSCLAKEPDQRPSSARALAGAMKGGPAAAAAAVPAGFDPTRVMGESAATQQLTSPTAYANAGAAPATRTGTAYADPDRQGVSVWVRVILGVLALVALWAILQFTGLLGGSDPAEPPATTPPATTTTTTTTTTTNAPTIDRSIYIGRNADAVETALRGLGYSAFRREQVDSDQPSGTIVDIQPYGSVPVGETITLQVSRGPAPTTATQEPSPPPAPSPTTPAPAPTAPTTSPSAQTTPPSANGTATAPAGT